MKYLLDTHTALWFFDEIYRLPMSTCALITDPTNEMYVSIASAWELAIKICAKKMDFVGGVKQFFHLLEDNDIELLPIKPEYLKIVETLPLIHSDPFDRILIATAMSEDVCLVTKDENIHKYDVPWIW
jgi:PIN domain nuclease of toxin-antitoxin system